MSIDQTERWRVLWPEERALIRSAIDIRLNTLSGSEYDRDNTRLKSMYRQLHKVEQGPRRRVTGIVYDYGAAPLPKRATCPYCKQERVPVGRDFEPEVEGLHCNTCSMPFDLQQVDGQWAVIDQDGRRFTP